MNHLVISVSPDSSLDLLGEFADVIVLDTQLVPETLPGYDTLYIRSYFGQESLMPQAFLAEINALVERAVRANPSIQYIDGISTVEAVLAFEDKWHQYGLFSDYMPKTELLSSVDMVNFTRPVYKKRLSSRGTGVTWSLDEISGYRDDWLVQESLEIQEEIRMYVIRGAVYPIGAIRQSKTIDQGTKAVAARPLTQDEIDFAQSIAQKASDLDIIGLDIVCNEAGDLFLLEVNRSPGFGKFYELTGVNLADHLYEVLSNMNELYDEAIQADNEGRLTEWLAEYLRNSGRNAILADGLEEDGQYHTQLMNYPIHKLKILRGPDASYRYPEEPAQYESRVNAMIESLKQVWKPVPLIATQDLWNPGLELNDGAHRAEALKRFGIEAYPTVVYFKNQVSLDTFLKDFK